jgi:hypothetical protein
MTSWLFTPTARKKGKEERRASRSGRKKRRAEDPSIPSGINQYVEMIGYRVQGIGYRV